MVTAHTLDDLWALPNQRAGFLVEKAFLRMDRYACGLGVRGNTLHFTADLFLSLLLLCLLFSCSLLSYPALDL